MDFKAEILQGLHTGASHEDLLAIVRRHKCAGLSQREVYDHLEIIWKDMGFEEDNHDKENPLRDNLEYVMEIVWGFCPHDAALWEASLSN